MFGAFGNFRLLLSCVIIALHRLQWNNIPSCLTVLQRGSSHLRGGGACPSAIAGLDHDSILGELLQVVQHQAFCIVPCGFHTDHAKLVVSAWAVLSVAHLVASDGPILEVLLGWLSRGMTKIVWDSEEDHQCNLWGMLSDRTHCWCWLRCLNKIRDAMNDTNLSSKSFKKTFNYRQ